MLDKDSAERLALQAVNKAWNYPTGDNTIGILDEFTIECDYGWIFVYNSSKYIRERDPLAGLMGNGPVVVSRSGVVEILPSAISSEEALERTKDPRYKKGALGFDPQNPGP